MWRLITSQLFDWARDHRDAGLLRLERLKDSHSKPTKPTLASLINRQTAKYPRKITLKPLVWSCLL